MLATNVTGVLLTTFAFIELLDEGNKRNVEKKLPSSQLVTTGSAGGFARQEHFIYNASKAAVTHMMKCLATTLVPWGIRSNIIAPGCKSIPPPGGGQALTVTVFLSQITSGWHDEIEASGKTVPKNLVPEERFGTEEEMAGTILYLASKAGGYCNGNVLLVDGGTLSVVPSTY